jgi:hypothetical protein
MSVVDTSHIDPRVEFWSDQTLWPRDATGVLFLGRVVRHLGGLMFGGAWAGCEPMTEIMYAIRPQLSAETPRRDIDYACALLYDKHLGYRQRADRAVAAREPVPLPTPDEWAVARAWSEAVESTTAASLNRFLAVIDVLTRVFEQGMVATALRPNQAGGLIWLKAGDWFNECYVAWFSTCQVHPENHFTRVPTRSGGLWIYVDAESYLKWLALAFDTVGAHAARVATTSPNPPDDLRANDKAAPDVPFGSGAHESFDDALRADGETVSSVGSAEARDTTAPVSGRPVSGENEARARRRKVGARRQYPWDDFKAEIVRRVRARKAPQTVHEFADEMAHWCNETWGREPSNSRLRHYIDETLAENGLSLDDAATSKTEPRP